MNYLLDTSICVFWLRGERRIEQKAQEIGLGEIALPSVSLSELYYVVYKSQAHHREP